MTSTSTQSGEAGPASNTDVVRPLRAPRRGPADLPFHFAGRALVEQLASERNEPVWLRDERLAASAAFEALPVEANQLYTPYVDLRGASLDTARPYILDGPPGLGDDLRAPDLPPSVHVETMSQWLARDPAGFRATIEGGRTLPGDDKLAQLARGSWSHGRHVEIPAGLALAEPIVLR